jgi:hypothetical protein
MDTKSKFGMSEAPALGYRGPHWRIRCSRPEVIGVLSPIELPSYREEVIGVASFRIVRFLLYYEH